MDIDRALTGMGLCHPDLLEKCVTGKYLSWMRQIKP
jgi:hypothetical protein